MRVPIGIAMSDPSMIPVEMVIPMKAPTCPFCSPSTVPGALIAHRVLRYPFEKANRSMSKILNQSEFHRASGEIYQVVNMKVPTNMTLAIERMIVILSEIKNVGIPPIFLPIVSPMLKIVAQMSTNQLNS